MLGVIDSHIHLDIYCKSDREHIINSLNKYTIRNLVTVSNDFESLKKLIDLSKQFSFIKPCAGYHPEQSLVTNKIINEMFTYIRANQSSIYGIGEVGLPYYIRKNETTFNKTPYIELLEKFIILAKELDKPLNLHAIYEDTKIVCQLLEKHDYHRAHFHWIKTDKETLDLMIASGYLISITPDVNYKERTRRLVKYYPIELMMIETDGPWKYEHQNNVMTHPKMLYDIIKQIAYIKEDTILNIEKQILSNTKHFYKI